MRIACIYLAAGLSRRFGENKLLSKYKGRPLFNYGLDALIKCFATSCPEDDFLITVVCGKESGCKETDIESYVNQYAHDSMVTVRTVVNEKAQKGISTSIKCGAESVPGADAYLFMVADEPNIKASTISELIAAFKNSPKGIMYASHDDIPGNPVIFSDKYIPELIKLEGDCGGKKIVRAHMEDAEGFEVSDAEELEDIDEKHSFFSLVNSSANRRIENDELIHTLGLQTDRPMVVSVVGAGGKTSFIDILAREIEKQGHRVLVATTTHMGRPKGRSVFGIDEMISGKVISSCDERVVFINGREGIVRGNDGISKLSSISFADIDELKKYGIPILIEADGSKCLPCKAPAEHEPVIYPKSDIVVGIEGTAAVGKKIIEGAHRPSLVATALDKDIEDLITYEDLVLLLNSEKGQKKDVKSSMKYIALINEFPT